jgi:uncharacterized repeat protein (TIGR04052 family)
VKFCERKQTNRKLFPILNDGLTVQWFFGLSSLLILFGAHLSISCSKVKENGPLPTPTPSSANDTNEQVVEIPFRALIGNEDFDCKKSYTLGADQTQIQPKDFRYFVSDIKFINTDGSKESLRLEQDGQWQRGNVVLLDYATAEANCAKSSSPDAATHTSVRGVIKKGTYIGIEFALGLDDKTNHLDAATAEPPLNNPGMWWSWKGGYKEIRLEMTVTSDGPAKGKDYLVHHGATGCSGNSPETFTCKNENNALILLQGNPLTSGITFDLSKLFEGEKLQEELTQNLSTTKQMGVVANPSSWGCMAFVGDGDCEYLFANLGLSFSEAVAGLAPQQKVFSLFSNENTSKGTDSKTIKVDASTCTTEKKAKIGDDCFERDPNLNVTLEVGDANHAAGVNGFQSHNAGLSCVQCHQLKGPGKGLHTFSGTIYKADLSTPAADAKIVIYNDFARTQIIKELRTDRSGNFYTTLDYLSQLNNPNKEYWVTVMAGDGSGEKKMMSSKITGQCSQCHIGGQRIWINK